MTESQIIAYIIRNKTFETVSGTQLDAICNKLFLANRILLFATAIQDGYMVRVWTMP